MATFRLLSSGSLDASDYWTSSYLDICPLVRTLCIGHLNDFMRFLVLLCDFLGLLELLSDSSLLGILRDSSLLDGGPTLRTWKATTHLGGLRNPLALYLELMVAHPRVVTRLRTQSNLRWVGRPFNDLFPRVFPGA
jgi:hypothetical protein